MRDAVWNPIGEGIAPLASWKRPRRVRLAHDLFDKNVNDETIVAAWDAMWAAPKHRFLVVTDDTLRLRDWTWENACQRHFNWSGRDHMPTLDPGDHVYMDELYYRGRCGWVNDGIDDNNGYGCAHPENESDGECHTYECPIAYSAGLCENCENAEDDCTCENYSENHELMELWRRPRYAVAGNVWIGTRVNSLDEAEERLPKFQQAKGAVRFVECAPGVDIGPWVRRGADVTGSSHGDEDWSIGWVVTNGVWSPTDGMVSRRMRRKLPVVPR